MYEISSKWDEVFKNAPNNIHFSDQDAVKVQTTSKQKYEDDVDFKISN